MNADIGLIGLAVMGENLVLNMESHRYTVAVFNRTVARVDNFLAGRAKGKKIIGTIMAKLFKEHNPLEVDGFAVTREERYLNREDASDGGCYKSKTYTVTKL